MALYLCGPFLVLHHAADPGPDGCRGRGEQFAMAVHGHARRHAAAERAIWVSRQDTAAHAVYSHHLQVLRRSYAVVRAGAALGRHGADGVGGPDLFYLGLG